MAEKGSIDVLAMKQGKVPSASLPRQSRSSEIPRAFVKHHKAANAGAQEVSKPTRTALVRACMAFPNLPFSGEGDDGAADPGITGDRAETSAAYGRTTGGRKKQTATLHRSDMPIGCATASGLVSAFGVSLAKHRRA